MTLQAITPVRVTIPERQEWVTPLEPYRCQIPGCPRQGTQWHHIVRRSDTAGPKDWIAIDGIVVWNKARVCLWCHDRINSHKYWIMWGEDGRWALYAREQKRPDSVGAWVQHPKSGDWFAWIGDLTTQEGAVDDRHGA